MNSISKNFLAKKFSEILLLMTNYSKSLRFGFLDGSLDRSPKINKETKKIIVV